VAVSVLGTIVRDNAGLLKERLDISRALKLRQEQSVHVLAMIRRRQGRICATSSPGPVSEHLLAYSLESAFVFVKLLSC
jgi:hypothetical protein